MYGLEIILPNCHVASADIATLQSAISELERRIIALEETSAR